MNNKYSYSIKELTSRLFALAKPIKGYLVISTLASIFGNLSHMGVMGFGAMWILTYLGYSKGEWKLYFLLTILSGILIALCRYLEGVFSHLGAYGILAKLRVSLFTSINRISPAFLIDNSQGDILNIAVNDIETLEFFFAHTIGPMFTVIILPLTSIFIACRFSRYYVYILIPIYLLISVIFPLIALKLGRGIGTNYRKSLGQLKAIILESVYGIKDIQIYENCSERIDKVLKSNANVNHSAHGLVLHGQTVSSLPNLFIYIARILIVAIAGYLGLQGKGDITGAIVVSFVASASFSSTFNLTFVVTHLLEAYASAERMFLIQDAPCPTLESDKPIACNEIKDVEFKNITFAYPKTNKNILENSNLIIKKGQHIGICGESGSGKSTIIRLLLRFYNPNSGDIYINNINIKDMSFNDLYSHIGVLEQDTYLFNMTIAQNIAIGKSDATLDEIKQAAKQAGLSDFIDTLPNGYDTDMGTMSARLSGGERQRVGIARVLLKNPDIIFMDEPTSALDVLHEKELIHILQNNFKDRTVILISHRHSTLANCDRFITLKDKQIVNA